MEREREKYKSIGCCCCFFSALCLDRETLAHTQVPFDMYVCANDKARVFVNKCMLLYRCSNVMWCDSFAIIMIAASFGFYFAWVLIWYALLCLASNTLRLQACTMYSLHFMLKSNQKVFNKIRMYKMCVFCRSNYLSIYLLMCPYTTVLALTLTCTERDHGSVYNSLCHIRIHIESSQGRAQYTTQHTHIHVHSTQ